MFLYDLWKFAWISISALTIVAAAPAIADTQEDAFVREFRDRCVMPLVNDQNADLLRLIALTADEIAQLLGGTAEQHAATIASGERLFVLPDYPFLVQILNHQSPNGCRFMMKGSPAEASMVSDQLMTIEFEKRKPLGVSPLRKGSAYMSGGGSINTKVGDEYVSVLLRYLGDNAVGDITLIAIRTGKTPYICDVFPKDCD